MNLSDPFRVLYDGGKEGLFVYAAKTEYAGKRRPWSFLASGVRLSFASGVDSFAVGRFRKRICLFQIFRIREPFFSLKARNQKPSRANGL